MAKVSMKGVIDMHVHSNPDIRVRAYNMASIYGKVNRQLILAASSSIQVKSTKTVHLFFAIRMSSSMTSDTVPPKDTSLPTEPSSIAFQSDWMPPHAAACILDCCADTCFLILSAGIPR